MAANSTTYALKFDIHEAERNLESLKNLNKETFKSAEKTLEDLSKTEEKYNQRLRETRGSIDSLEKQIKDLNAQRNKNGALTKEQNSELRKLNALHREEIRNLRRLKQEERATTSAINQKVKAQADSRRSINQQIRAQEQEISGLIRKQKAENSAAETSKKANAIRNSQWNAFIRHIRQLETTIVLYYGLTRAYDKTIGRGVELNKTIQSTSYGLAALLTSNTKLMDGTNELENQQLHFSKALELSQETMMKLKDASALTIASFPELTQVFQQAIGYALGFGDAFGRTTEQVVDRTIEIAQAMTNMGGAVGMSQDLVQEEIRSLFSGDVTRDSKLAILLFGNPAEANKAIKEAGNNVDGVYNLLKGKLEAFSQLAGIDTLAMNQAKALAEYDKVMSQIAQPVFEDINDIMREATMLLKENEEAISEWGQSAYGSSKSVLSAMDEVAIVVGGVFAAKTTADMYKFVTATKDAAGSTSLLRKAVFGLEHPVKTAEIGFKALNAIVAKNPFIAISTAIIAATTALVAYNNARLTSEDIDERTKKAIKDREQKGLDAYGKEKKAVDVEGLKNAIRYLESIGKLTDDVRTKFEAMIAKEEEAVKGRAETAKLVALMKDKDYARAVELLADAAKEWDKVKFDKLPDFTRDIMTAQDELRKSLAELPKITEKTTPEAEAKIYEVKRVYLDLYEEAVRKAQEKRLEREKKAAKDSEKDWAWVNKPIKFDIDWGELPSPEEVEILKQVNAGRITIEDADKLIAALNGEGMVDAGNIIAMTIAESMSDAIRSAIKDGSIDIKEAITAAASGIGSGLIGAGTGILAQDISSEIGPYGAMGAGAAILAASTIVDSINSSDNRRKEREKELAEALKNLEDAVKENTIAQYGFKEGTARAFNIQELEKNLSEALSLSIGFTTGGFSIETKSIAEYIKEMEDGVVSFGQQMPEVINGIAAAKQAETELLNARKAQVSALVNTGLIDKDTASTALQNQLNSIFSESVSVVDRRGKWGGTFKDVEVSNKSLADLGITIENFPKYLEDAQIEANNVSLGLADSLSPMAEAILEVVENVPDAIDVITDYNEQILQDQEQFVGDFVSGFETLFNDVYGMVNTLESIGSEARNRADEIITSIMSPTESLSYLKDRYAAELADVLGLEEKLKQDPMNQILLSQYEKETADLFAAGEKLVDASSQYEKSSAEGVATREMVATDLLDTEKFTISQQDLLMDQLKAQQTIADNTDEIKNATGDSATALNEINENIASLVDALEPDALQGIPG